MDRKLAAIMVADIVGSTPAMEADEEAAVRRIAKGLSAIEAITSECGGRVFSTAGDAVLAEFSSPVKALEAAIASRTAITESSDMSAEDLRIGLHLADVIVRGDDLRGDGVNVAARIQAAAMPGSIDISGAVFDHVRRTTRHVFSNLGQQTFRGISDPIQIFRVLCKKDRDRYQVVSTKTPAPKHRNANSVVVLPLANTAPAGEDQRFLAEGLTDDLTLELSRYHSLFVISRTAATAVSSQDPVEIGRNLGVEYILSGSVRKLGDRIRFNISLIETKDGTIVWSDRIKRQFDDVFDIMEEITTRTAATVTGRIEHAAVVAARLKRPENMSAYECYLKGIEHHRMGGVTDDHVYKAVEWFEKAIQLDPGFGRPYAMQQCSMSYLPEFDIDYAAKRVAKAMELDPTDPEAHRIMGIIRIKLHNDYDASQQSHDKACDLAPHDAYILGRCAAFYTFNGDVEKALALLDKAEVLDPFLPVWVTEERVAAYYSMGAYDKMLSTINALPFQTRRTCIYKAATLVAQDQLENAKAQIKKALEDDPNLSADYIRAQELYKDKALLNLLISRACEAGLPRAAVTLHAVTTPQPKEVRT